MVVLLEDTDTVIISNMMFLEDLHLHSECDEVFSSVYGVSLQCALNHI